MKKTMMLLSLVVGMLALSSALASGYSAADLRFGHDTVFFPLVLFLEADTFGHLPADFDDVKNWIQSQTCKQSEAA